MKIKLALIEDYYGSNNRLIFLFPPTYRNNNSLYINKHNTTSYRVPIYYFDVNYGVGMYSISSLTHINLTLR